MKKFIVIVLIFWSTLFNIKTIKASDINVHLEWVSGVYANTEVNGKWYYSQMAYLYMNNELSYCLNPSVAIKTSDYFLTDVFDMNEDLKNRIELISYYGYDYPNHQNLYYYMATQELIWREIGITNVNYTTRKNFEGNIINIDMYKNEIIDLVNKHYVKPSFDNINLKEVIGDTVILEDKNNVLNQYEIINNYDNAWIDNNSLIINVNSFGNHELVLRKKIYNYGTSIIGYADNSQTLAKLYLSKDVISNINIEGYPLKGIIKIKKYGNMLTSFNSYIDYPLNGVIYGIYANRDVNIDGIIYKSGDLIETIITDEDGLAQSKELPIASYYIKELSTLPGYNKDENYYCFEFNQNSRIDDKLYQKYEFYNNLILGSVSFKKYGEILSNVIDNNFIYDYNVLPNIGFGLYSKNDIYNTKGDLVIKKDEQLITVFSDKNGNIKIDNIPVGEYYIKELSTIDGYIVDNKKYEFTIDKDNYKVVIDNIYNALIKGSLELYKFDKDTLLPLKNVEYKLYDVNNNYLLTLYTNSDGYIKLNDIAIGKYYLKETKTNDDYMIDENIYEIDITLDNLNHKYKFYNEKIKMPITNDYQLPIKLLSLTLFILGIFSYVKTKNI